MTAHAYRAPALAVEWNDRFSSELPCAPNIRQSGIHRSGSFFSARCIERKLNKWDKLIQRLLLRKLTGPLSASKIKSAVLDREPPVQCIDIACEHGAKFAGLLVDAKVYRCSRHGVFQRDCTCHGKRAQPRETIGRITKALAKEN